MFSWFMFKKENYAVKKRKTKQTKNREREFSLYIKIK